MATTEQSPVALEAPVRSGGTSRLAAVSPVPLRTLARAAVVVAVAAGVVFRFVTTSDLWIDESLSVNISRLPLGELFEALRHDGHPPLYYILLHYWMAIFGEGNFAVRVLSGLFSVATLPLMWVAARRYGGRSCAVAALVLLSLSPYAIRYGSETRMYSMVAFLVVLGWLAVRNALEQPRAARLLAVGVISGLLLLSHYWSIYLVGAVLALLGILWWRSGDNPAHRRAVGRTGASVMAGAVLFLPWLPSFLYQAQNTGTPWGVPNRPAAILVISLDDFGGGPYPEAKLLGTVLIALVGLALFGRAVRARHIELDFATRPEARPEVFLIGATVAIATVFSYIGSATFAARYSSVFFPLVILVAALGVTRIPTAKGRTAVLVLAGALGVMGGGYNTLYTRSQAGELAGAISSEVDGNDVVAYCPDQLGPSVSRLLPDETVGLTFPEASPPQRVDWVDYEERNQAGDPDAFARTVVERAGQGTVWYVFMGAYRTLDQKCEEIATSLRDLRPDERQLVKSKGENERGNLLRFRP